MLWCGRITPGPAPTKDVTKDIGEVAKTTLAEAALAKATEATLTAKTARLGAGRAKLVVLGPLLVVTQGFVGLVYLFKLFFGARLVVYVRVVLGRQLPVGPLNFGLRGVLFDTENVV